MKKSEELTLASQQEDNDIKSFALLCKALREKRSEKFEEDWLEPLGLRYPITQRSNGSYSITTQKYGIVDYFPKANKLLIRQDNNWKKPGLAWIIKNLTQ
jgi:hypothetical protein